MKVPKKIRGVQLDRIQREEMQKVLAEVERRRSQRAWLKFFPDDGPLSFRAYPKQMEFWALGKNHRERAFMAGNRVGKTVSAAYEMSRHLSGNYPSWWPGRAYRGRPVMCLAAGDTAKTTRDIMQKALLGPPGAWGTGLIEGEKIIKIVPKPGVPEAVETVYVKHISGGQSELMFRSYDQGVQAFQGIERDVIWPDEECELDLYTEMLVRTMTTKGMVLATFTPMLGMTETVRYFLENKKPVVMCGWDDVPHLTEQDKAELTAGIPPYQLEARSKGHPVLGAGAVYPLSEDIWVVEPFEIPKHWPRGYGLDVGWNWTGAVWGAMDPESGCTYLYREYKRGQAEPAIHAAAIGKDLKGAIDWAGTDLTDGKRVVDEYRRLGLRVVPANKALEAGLAKCHDEFSTGKLKVFSTLSEVRQQMRTYQRDQRGRIKAQTNNSRNDLLDAMRYLRMTPGVLQSSGRSASSLRDFFSHGAWMGS